MTQIYDSLKALINPEISKTSAVLGETESRVSTATSGIVAGLLGQMVKKGSSSSLESILQEAGKADLRPHTGTICAGKAAAEQEGIGKKFLNTLMGTQTDDFVSSIASHSGISASNSKKLTTMISTIVAGYFGHKMLSGKVGLSDLVGELGKEKSGFMSAIPAGIGGVLGLTASNRSADKKEEKKKGYGWLLWLLLLLALLLLLIFGWRSCKSKKVPVHQIVESTEVVVQHPVATAPMEKVMIDLTLPNGQKIQGYKNGMEDKMIMFLNSNEYKNASADDLKTKWFEFEDVDFAHDSATELSATSGVHLKNIAMILKAYPDAKIDIAGQADNSGNRIYNMEISKERAAYIKSTLGRDGIAASRVIVEGFGDKYATIPASASDDARAKDRDIAFRFVK